MLFFPEVEEDVFGGYLWYEAKSSGLGEEFLIEKQRRTKKTLKPVKL